MNIQTEYLKIPGLKKTYNFFHISDVHAAVSFPGDSEEEAALAEKQTKQWTTDGIAPPDAFDRALKTVGEFAAENKDTVTALMIAGDGVDYHSGSNVRFLKERMEACPVDVLYVHGNHEGARIGEMVPHMRAFYPSYAELMGKNPAFWVKDYGELLIIGMDDSDKKITEEQLRLLKEQLERKIPVILVMHIPFYTDEIYEPLKARWGEGGTVYFSLDKDNCTALTAEFRDIVKDPENCIAAVMAGHVHFSHTGDLGVGAKTGKPQFVSAPCFTGYMRRLIVSGE